MVWDEFFQTGSSHTNKPQSEKYIEKKVCDYAIDLGFYVRKFTSPQQRSVPDRIFLFDGNVFFIEFKAPGKKLTEAQIKEKEKTESAGGVFYMVDNIDRGKEIINHYKEKSWVKRK